MEKGKEEGQRERGGAKSQSVSRGKKLQHVEDRRGLSNFGFQVEYRETDRSELEQCRLLKRER